MSANDTPGAKAVARRMAAKRAAETRARQKHAAKLADERRRTR